MKQKSRKETSQITSVSISQHFHNLIKLHNFSPTEVFRRGMAVMLYEAGDLSYETKLNKKRAEEIKPFLDSLREYEEMKEKVKKLIS